MKNQLISKPETNLIAGTICIGFGLLNILAGNFILGTALIVIGAVI